MQRLSRAPEAPTLPPSRLALRYAARRNIIFVLPPLILKAELNRLRTVSDECFGQVALFVYIILGAALALAFEFQCL